MSRCWLVVLFAWATALSCEAGIATNNLRMSVDVPSTFRGDDYSGRQAIGVGPGAAGPLLTLDFPGASRLHMDALCVRSNLVVFSCDVDFVLNSIEFADEDLVAFDKRTGVYSMFFDGSARGIPPAADVDAASFVPGTTNLLLSFDTTVTLPGAGSVDDDDVVLCQGGTFAKQFDGATQLGLRPAADVDALHLDGTNLYYSLDISYRRGGLSGSDDDLWIFNTNTLATSLMGTIGLPRGADLADVDDPVDADGDGLTDLEETTATDEPGTTFPGTGFALNPSPYQSNPNSADSDADGAGDWAEAAAGTNPTNSGDYLRITSVNQGSGQVIRWASVNGKLYDVEFAGTIQPFTNTAADNVNASGSSTAITNPGVSASGFYRVRLEPQ
jgi:hypothetical protein